MEVENKPLKHRGSLFNNLWSKTWTSSGIPKLVLFPLFTIKILLDNQNKRKISRKKGRRRKLETGPTAVTGPTAETGRRISRKKIEDSNLSIMEAKMRKKQEVEMRQ